VRSNLEHEAEHRSNDELRGAAIDQLLDRNRFELPEQAVEKQIVARFNTFISSLTQQGVDPRKLRIDWEQVRDSQRERAERDVRLTFILDRVADAETIEVTTDEIDQEIERIAEGTDQPAASLRARLTKEGALDSIKEQVRSRKALDLIIASAEIITEEIEGPGEAAATTGNEDGQTEG
jgi:trigger factor